MRTFGEGQVAVSSSSESTYILRVYPRRGLDVAYIWFGFSLFTLYFISLSSLRPGRQASERFIIMDVERASRTPTLMDLCRYRLL